MPKKIDLSGQRFFRLTAIREHGYRNKKVWWWCRCDCGVEKEVAAATLRQGKAKSCGCWKAEEWKARQTDHGCSRYSWYKSWEAAKSRCQNPNNDVYHLYGGRGIRFCERWEDPRNFLADMGERPAGMSLDRINPDGHYEPGNCRWATSLQQGQFRRTNRRLEINGETLNAFEASRKYGLSPTEICRRVDSGMTAQEAIEIGLKQEWRRERQKSA